MTNNQELGFCGVDCGKCPVFIATKSNDYNKRKEVAEMLYKAHNVTLEPDQINCTGCYRATMEGTAIMAHCETCNIRPCAKEKNVTTCANCTEYACTKLTEKWAKIPNGQQAKENLYAIKKPRLN